MCSISQTVRPSENVGFNVGDPRGPSCVKALFGIYNDVGVSVFSKVSSPRIQAPLRLCLILSKRSKGPNIPRALLLLNG